MKNQVIKVLNEEHGKKVIQYWKNQGVDTRRYTGINDTTYCYYGVVNNIFGQYRSDQLDNYNIEVITLPEELTFPRQMLVWDVEDSKAKILQVVAYVPVLDHPYIVNETQMYRYAKEIPSYSLPIIGGQEGEQYSHNKVKYGCVFADIADLKQLSQVRALTSTKSIMCITLEGNIVITMDKIDQIIEYFDNQ